MYKYEEQTVSKPKKIYTNIFDVDSTIFDDMSLEREFGYFLNIF